MLEFVTTTIVITMLILVIIFGVIVYAICCRRRSALALSHLPSAVVLQHAEAQAIYLECAHQLQEAPQIGQIEEPQANMAVLQPVPQHLHQLNGIVAPMGTVIAESR